MRDFKRVVKYRKLIQVKKFERNNNLNIMCTLTHFTQDPLEFRNI